MMSQFVKARRSVFVFSAVLAIALIAEFVLLEGTLGVSLPKDRNSAVSTLEIKVKGTEPHFITRNRRFTVVELLTEHGTRSEVLVLRETLFMDRAPDVEGPPNATVTVEAMNGEDVRWTFQEPGERGEPVTGDVYLVTKFSGGETPATYTYFSLRDGSKLRAIHNKLSDDELAVLDASVVK
jgi:hypothetical protein